MTQRTDSVGSKSVELEFISNTGFYLAHKKVVFGMDLWLTQGAFEGSWFHFPPHRPTKYSITDCRYIYISHIHPDHCDFNHIKNAKAETTFIVPNYFDHLLARKLKAFGFKNIVSLEPEEERTLEKGLKIKMFPQFINNLFHKADIGSLIDSALLIQWDSRTILNCNDNYIDSVWAEKLAKQYPEMDLAILPHSASGPYPASFRNLTAAEKEREAKRLQSDFINHFVEMTEILKPKYVLPAAGDFMIAGRHHTKNKFLGLADPKEACGRVNARQKTGAPGTKAVQLDCGTVLDIDSGEVSGLEVRHPTAAEKWEYAEKLKGIYYPYEWEENLHLADFDELFRQARGNLWAKQERFGWKRDVNLYFVIDEIPAYEINFSKPEFKKLEGKLTQRKEPYMECYLPRQLFYQILTKRAHWNNAEGGLHIDFYRQPNDYIPEVHTFLSFLHIPL